MVVDEAFQDDRIRQRFEFRQGFTSLIENPRFQSEPVYFRAKFEDTQELRFFLFFLFLRTVVPQSSPTALA